MVKTNVLESDMPEGESGFVTGGLTLGNVFINSISLGKKKKKGII